MLELKNPHSVLAALERRPQDVVEIRMLGHAGDAWNDVLDLAKVSRVPIVSGSLDRVRRQRRDGKEERIGIAVARVKDPPEVSVDELFAPAANPAPDRPGLWIALDCLQDPHNVGAIFRTAGFFGVQGIVFSRDRSAPLNSTVCDVAAGGVEAVPFCSVPNLRRVLEQAKERGLWLLGTSEHAQDNLESFGPDRPWLLVLGNEEKGLRQLTLDACDNLCAIKPRGHVGSLNVSVAAGICISWLCRM